MSFTQHFFSFIISYAKILFLYIICIALLSSCTCESNKTPPISEKQEIKKVLQPDTTEPKKVEKKSTDVTRSNFKLSNNKLQVINVPVQRGIQFVAEQKSILYARPKGIDPRVILINTTNNTVQSYSMKHSLQIDTSSFAPGGYDVYITKQTLSNQLSLFLIKTGEKPSLNASISQPLWFIEITNKKNIRPFQDLGDGTCFYPIWPEDIYNSSTYLFPTLPKQLTIKFDQLAPRSAQYVSFLLSGESQPLLPDNSFIDFFYSTRRIPLTPIKRIWLLSGLPHKQQYSFTLQVPTVKNYHPHKYLSYRASPNLQNKFKFSAFVKGWKIQISK